MDATTSKTRANETTPRDVAWTTGAIATGEWRLALASVVLCTVVLLVAELAVRRFSPADVEVGGMIALHQYSEVYGWTPRPGARFLDDGQVATINANGYRGRLVATQPPPGVTRVVMLGDSVTFGLHVADDDTFAHLLDSWDNGLEVVNLAVQGYGLDQDLLKLEHEGLSYSPRIVVLNLCLDNDFADSALPVFLYDGQYPKPFYRLEGGRLVLHREQLRRSWLANLADELRHSSHLYVWLTSRKDVPQGEAADGEDWTTRRARALRDVKGVEELGFRLIQRMDDEATHRGVAFIVVLHPNKPSYRQGSQWIDDTLSSPVLEGIPVIDLRHEYLARGARWNEIALDDIGHLRPAGNRLAAQILQDLLR
jgi:hypothetical protein